MGKAKLLHKQKIRFTIDVEVSVVDFPQALLDGLEVDDKYDSWKKEDPEGFIEFLEFQKRILYAVTNSPDVISQLVVEDAGAEAANYLEKEYLSYNSEAPLDKTLSPAIDSMSAEDRKRIQELINNEVLSDNTETALYDSFRTKVVDTDIKVIE